jgi:hypothetical protein
MQRYYFAPAATLAAALLFITAGCGGGSAQPFVAPPKASIPSISFGTGTPNPMATACPNSGCTTSFTVSEPGYNGAFHGKSSNTNVVTIAPGGGSAMGGRKAQDTSATFIVTAVGTGTATLTITDDNGNTASVPVTVSAGLSIIPQLQR